MKINPEIHHRHSLRLQGFDYSSPGFYFVTICTQNRMCLFGDINERIMVLNDAGEAVNEEWANLSLRFPHIVMGKYVVMPNHIHAIIHITGGPPFDAIRSYFKFKHKIPDDTESMKPGTAKNSIGRIIQGFKSITTHSYIQGVKNHDWPTFEGHLWQRNFYDRILRNRKELADIREYIGNNPPNWEWDEDNPHSNASALRTT
jgi:REP element-mobilizing transposase RayT